MIACSWKENLGIECLTCGFQRSFFLLMDGNIIESIQMFPATIPFLASFLLVAIHLIFKLKNGAKIILGTYITAVTIMVISYVIKIINGEIYT
ncbi:MAG: DUF2752 domain-containing protein [Flavobacteriia bacterium]|nr:DUF2752 domain-containing protein [Flavobacteriia bacterium]